MQGKMMMGHLPILPNTAYRDLDGPRWPSLFSVPGQLGGLDGPTYTCTMVLWYLLWCYGTHAHSQLPERLASNRMATIPVPRCPGAHGNLMLPGRIFLTRP